MSSFLANLSWHDDNKIQMYQYEEVILSRVLLLDLLIEAESAAFAKDVDVTTRLHQRVSPQVLFHVRQEVRTTQ